MIRNPCEYGVDHETHDFPDDWEFGGPRDMDPRADARWQPTTYEYWDDRLERIHITQVPLCDDQALDEFTRIANRGPDWKPTMLIAIRPGGVPEMLPWVYDKVTDELRPKVKVSQ